MGYIEKLKNTKDKVEWWLKEHPHLRDDDNKLMANFWWKEIGQDETLSAKEFIRLFSEGTFTNPESIRRCRAKIQENDASLRGNFYKEKKKDGNTVKNNIHNL